MALMRKNDKATDHFAGRCVAMWGRVLGAFGLASVWLSATQAPGAINTEALGAHYNAGLTQIEFRVYSSRATRMELWLYREPLKAKESGRFEMTREAGGVWSKTISAAEAGGAIYYGYRAWGPNWKFDASWKPGSSAGFVSDVDAEGNRFDPNKLLLDPYAREVSHDPATPGQTDRTMYATGPRYRDMDSGPLAPKGIILPEDANLDTIRAKPERPLKDDIIYEVHLRGLTKNDPGVPEPLRGTYRGAALTAKYLTELGVTAVEFLPVQEMQNDANDAGPGGERGNYWGYATLNYFAPDRRYASDKSPGGPTREFREMVNEFHSRGIKVFLDVVYNHTGEGYAWRRDDKNTYNLISWRGLDNPTYYSLTRDRQGSWDNSGCGGNFNTFNPVAQNLIVDSLAYWRDNMGVDGFRFDLAPILGNVLEHGGFHYDRNNRSNALNRITAELKPRPPAGGAGVDLIAEPWAMGGNSYQVGGFPTNWSEWNGKFRDTIRNWQNRAESERLTPGPLAMRLAGSPDLYRASGRRPWNSINFITAHDGFTLRDLYSFDQKQNQQPWPFGPSDGGEEMNRSWNQGGDAKAQRQAARTGFALLMLSAGTPMVNGGDEFLRTLRGNNNPYDLDTVANWLNWNWGANEENFHTFAQRVIAFRRAHPALHPADFYSERDGNGNGMEQLRWFRPDGEPADAAYWSDAGKRAIAWRLDGTEFGDPAAAIFIAYNASPREEVFCLPSAGGERSWWLAMDTGTADETNAMPAAGAEKALGAERVFYWLRARAVAVFITK